MSTTGLPGTSDSQPAQLLPGAVTTVAQSVATGQVTTGLTGGGATAHFQVSYDSTLTTADGLTRANALLGFLEDDYAWLAALWSNLGLTVALPVSVQIIPGTYAVGSWSASPGNPTIIQLRPGNGTSLNIVRFMLIHELNEMFELAQGGGWYGSGNEGEQGEGLARVVAREFYVTHGFGTAAPSGFEVGNLWMTTSRVDYINSNDPTDGSADAKSGAATLFITYLKHQLGFTLPQIIGAAGATLTQVWRNLTGQTGDPFPAFKALLVAKYPGTAAITGADQDDPWPIRLSTATPWQAGLIGAVGQMALVERHPYAGSTISALHWVEGYKISISLRDGTGTTTFNVSRADPVPAGGYWRLGTSKLGVNTTLTW